MRTFVNRNGKLKRVNNRFNGEKGNVANPFAESDRRKRRRLDKAELDHILLDLSEASDGQDVSGASELDDPFGLDLFPDFDDTVIHLKFSGTDRKLVAACCF